VPAGLRIIVRCQLRDVNYYLDGSNLIFNPTYTALRYRYWGTGYLYQTFGPQSYNWWLHFTYYAGAGGFTCRFEVL